MPEGFEDWFGELDDDRNCEQQNKPQDQRRADTEPAGARLLFLRQLVGEYRNEDKIVDAEHHFHHDKRDKGYKA